MTISHKNLAGAQVHEPKDIASATSGQMYTADGAGSGSWSNSPAAYTKRNKTALQVITPAGPLTIAHTLGVIPDDWEVWLENVTPELGYTAGQSIKPAHTMSSAANQGVSIVADVTNLLIEYGAGSGGGVPVFQVINRTTNVSAGITNANWNMFVVSLGV